MPQSRVAFAGRGHRPQAAQVRRVDCGVRVPATVNYFLSGSLPQTQTVITAPCSGYRADFRGLLDLADNHVSSDRWLSPDACPRSKFSTLISSSRSSQ